VFENEVLRRIFGPKRDEVTGGWRKLHNEELHRLYIKLKTHTSGFYLKQISCTLPLVPTFYYKRYTVRNIVTIGIVEVIPVCASRFIYQGWVRALIAKGAERDETGSTAQACCPTRSHTCPFACSVFSFCRLKAKAVPK
jgi:hypothetical protein